MAVLVEGIGMLIAGVDAWQLSTLDSTDRRNSFPISLCRCFVAQRLAWPFVELVCHGIQLGLRDVCQADALREVLTQ